MKIRLIPLFLVIISILLSACQASSSATSDISFMVFGDPAELAAYQKLVDSFEQKFPDVQVELIQVPGQSDYRKRLSADMAAGNPADVLLINYRRYAGFANAGALEPLGSYLEKSGVIKEADFYPQAIQPYNGRVN